LTLQAVCFSLGLASSLATLGVVSTSLGRAYGSIGPGLPSLVAVVAIVMGLNLLEVTRWQWRGGGHSVTDVWLIRSVY
jgi:cytochrome c-type biogenesis protein